MSEATTIDETPPVEVGLNLRIETPENVILTYHLAGPAVRCGAYVIDLAVRVALLFAVGIVLTAGAFVLPGFSMGVLLFLMFINEWGYFVICECLFKGKSIGKHVLGLRVIHQKGYPVSFWTSAIRNLLRAADVMPLYGPAFVSMLCSSKFQRLGDLAAGTVVIKERRAVLPRDPIILERLAPLSRDEIGGFVPDHRTLSLIDQFLGRRQYLARLKLMSFERGHELAYRLAQILADRLDYHGDPNYVQQYPMAFLARVHVTFIQRRDDDNGDNSSPLDQTEFAASAYANGWES